MILCDRPGCGRHGLRRVTAFLEEGGISDGTGVFGFDWILCRPCLRELKRWLGRDVRKKGAP